MLKKRFFPVSLLVLLILIYYWKVILKGYLALPGDLLVGAYFPWLSEKWGTIAGVPVKNPLISDAFSQMYIWKSLVGEAIRNHTLPLWNPYSYFGYPLLANLQSGALNPANLLFVIFGDIDGWNLYVIAQRIIASISMYLFLTNHHKNKGAALVGGLLYSMSPFMTTWVQFGTMGYILAWLPLLFLFIERYIDTKALSSLLGLPILCFLVVTSGSFQGVFFGGLLCTLYFLFLLIRQKGVNKFKLSIPFVFFLLIGLGLSAIQILPTVELFQYSVREAESYSATNSYGLLPLGNILTILAPDYFGNPTTGNFWGFLNYHETLVYIGILPILATFSSFFTFKKLKVDGFFLGMLFLTFIFIFDNPVSRALYASGLPLVTTGLAGRAAIVITFCAAVLASKFIVEVKSLSTKSIIKITVLILLAYGTVLITTYGIHFIASANKSVVPELYTQTSVALRNLVFPFLVTLGFCIALLFRKKKIFIGLVILVLSVELMRFGWKYEPVVSRAYAFPKTEALGFLMGQEGTFRIEREYGPLLPPNTWSYFRLQSASGYDSLAPAAATLYYNKNYNNSSGLSRYLEMRNHIPTADVLGRDNVRFLLLLKYNQLGEIKEDGKYLNTKFDTSNWRQVFDGPGFVIMDNELFRQRVQSDTADVEILDYQPNSVSIKYQANAASDVVLKDAYYPGWNAYFNGEKYQIEKAEIFRKISLPKGEGTVKFIYEPDSFRNASIVSILAVFLYGFTVVVIKNKK